MTGLNNYTNASVIVVDISLVLGDEPLKHWI